VLEGLIVGILEEAMRKLIICNDGTWNSPDDKDRGKVKPTNITKISRAMLPVDSAGVSQLVFYDEGIGTGFGEKLIGGATGFGISKNILDSYRFLSHNYSVGDELYFFGFSRGAYTSRSLIGLIDLIGLVQKSDVFYLPKLYQMYRDQATREEVKAFCQSKNLQCHRPRVKLLGVFDTVGALGAPIKGLNYLLSKFKRFESSFHDVSLSGLIDNAYHALAIDERRVPFAPTLWEKPANDRVKMEQRWFAGAHSNIGGGCNPDDLANFALQYIVGKAKGCGLEFDDSYLSFFNGRVSEPVRDSMSLKYRVLGKHIRPINLEDGSNQVIDETVFAKKDVDESYRPENVIASQ